MRTDQRRVDIDHQLRRTRAELPSPCSRLGARGTQRVEQPGLCGDPVDQPERRRVRGDRAEQRLLVAHDAQVRQTDRQSPPSASITARSRITRPGSWRPRRSRTLASASDNARVNPTQSAVSASKPAPAWDTRPSPSDATSTVKKRSPRITRKVTSTVRDQGPSASPRIPAPPDVRRPDSNGAPGL